jgi:hypothetical protein
MAGVTLRRASAGVQSLCFLPPSSGRTQYDVWAKANSDPSSESTIKYFLCF